MRNDHASVFLSLLDPDASFFTFQIVPEPKLRPTGLPPQLLHGSFQDILPTLTTLNKQGAAIFVSVNATDGKGRRAENIIRTRCIWQDDDDGFRGVFPLEPSIIVSTSPGKFQRYWLTEGLSKDDYSAVMRTMVEQHGSDKQAGADIARVLRVPGFYHRKAEPYLVRIIEASGKRYAPEEVLKAFPQTEQEPASAEPFASISSHATDDQTFRIKSALKLISPDPYGQWLRVGQILHNEYGGAADGLFVWMQWAQGSRKFKAEEHRYKWRTFGRGTGPKLGLGTLFLMASQALYAR